MGGIANRFPRVADGSLVTELLYAPILIIEDELAMRKQMAQMLRFEGFATVEAENGSQGAAAAIASPPDLIICDILMPDLDGFGVLQALRENPRTAVIPFIFLTALGANQDLRHGMDEGADDYLTKPYRPAALLDSVHRRLEKRDRQMQECLLRAEEVVLENAAQCHQAEDELRWKTGFLEAQTNTLSDGILVTDPQGQILLQNQAFSDLFKLSLPGVEDKSHVKQLVWTSIKTKNPEKFVEKVVYLYAHPGEISRDEIELKDGRVLESRTSPVIHPDGTRYGRLWTFRDITDGKQAESQLRKLSRAVEQSPVSIVITDLEGGIEYVNPKFCAVSGYSFEEVRGKNPRMLKSGEKPPEAYQQMWATIAAGQEWRGEFHNRRKNGELYWESATISALRDDQNKVTHYIAVKEDISRVKRAEEELRTSQRRQTEMAQELIEHKQKEERSHTALEHEQKLSQIKDRFASMVSHEFRGPLSVISMAAELLDGYQDTMTGAERSEQLKEIQGAVGRMTQMMTDFLVHGVCTSGKLVCKPARVAVEALCRKLIAEMPGYPGLPHSIECAVDPAVGEAWLDEKIMRHILGNLLSNAVKYSFDGQPVKLEVRRVTGSLQPIGDPDESSASRLEFKIRDSGIGIPAADLAKLYQTFHRAANVGNRPGTGMGLAIVKQFVDLLGGSIRLESQEGKGTTVWVELPTASPASPADR